MKYILILRILAYLPIIGILVVTAALYWRLDVVNKDDRPIHYWSSLLVCAFTTCLLLTRIF